jgi:hypothetical protein
MNYLIYFITLLKNRDYKNGLGIGWGWKLAGEVREPGDRLGVTASASGGSGRTDRMRWCIYVPGTGWLGRRIPTGDERR